MVETMTEGSLDWRWRALGAAMRRWPRRFRKGDYLWSRIYASIGGGGFAEDPTTDVAWPAGLQAPTRGERHPYKLRLNLRDWMERRAYFSGAIYQRDLEAALAALVGHGDLFIDVGANIGMITLLGAHLVGETGKVAAFEVNPAVFARLQGHIRHNDLGSRVSAFDFGLADKDGEAHLHLASTHTGIGTLTMGAGTPVRIRRGDPVFAQFDSARPAVVKMDVEGFEGRVIAGLGDFLARDQVAIIMEVTPAMLARVGDSAAGLYEALKAKGFQGYTFEMTVGRWSTSLTLRPSASPEAAEQYDAIFVKPQSIQADRLVRLGLIAPEPIARSA